MRGFQIGNTLGRRKVTHCRKGHAFDEGNTIVTNYGARKCRYCLNRRIRLRYETNTAFRERKKASVIAYKRKFREQNGFWPDALYDRK